MAVKAVNNFAGLDGLVPILPVLAPTLNDWWFPTISIHNVTSWGYNSLRFTT